MYTELRSVRIFLQIASVDCYFNNDAARKCVARSIIGSTGLPLMIIVSISTVWLTPRFYVLIVNINLLGLLTNSLHVQHVSPIHRRDYFTAVSRVPVVDVFNSPIAASMDGFPKLRRMRRSYASVWKQNRTSVLSRDGLKSNSIISALAFCFCERCICHGGRCRGRYQNQRYSIRRSMPKNSSN